MTRARHGTTPGGVQLTLMSAPPHGTRRDLFSAAAQQNFDNHAENRMNKPAMSVANAIADQQATRQPARMPQNVENKIEPTRAPMVRLSLEQSSLLTNWIRASLVAIVGKPVNAVTNDFNLNVATNSTTFGDVRVTVNNVYNALKKNGLGVANYKIIAADPTLFTSVAPSKTVAASDPTPPLPPGIGIVQMYKGADGKLYENLEAALATTQIEEIGEFIQENACLDAADARELARRLLKCYPITKL